MNWPKRSLVSTYRRFLPSALICLKLLRAYIAPDVATKLYPHQKKALTFLLEREREKPGPDGEFSSLWQARINPISRQQSWFHLVTHKEIFQEPKESKGSILADDARIFSSGPKP